MSSALYPDFRGRYLPAFSPVQREAFSPAASDIAICPTGAIEQHGPHLPVGTDSIAAHAWIDLLLEKLTPVERAKVWAGPAIPVGKSNEHTGYPGTLTLSAASLRRQVLSLARTIKSFGLKRLYLLNGHGGNVSVLRYSLEEAATLYGLECGLLRPEWKVDLPARELKYGIHAGEIETAWLLHFCPEAVRFERADTCWIGPEKEPEGTLLRPEFAGVTYSWVTADISPTGTMGDATRATPEKGAQWVEEYAIAYAGAVRKLIAG
jgi:creatinine amidohydrolase